MHRRNAIVARLVAMSALTLICLVPTLSAGAAPEGAGRQVYHCRMSATPYPARITVRYRLTTSVAHHAWRIRIWDNGTRVYSAIRRTDSNGDLTVMTAIENLHGRDELLGRARDLSSGSVCAVEFKV
jgi:hypothetical protein